MNPDVLKSTITSLVVALSSVAGGYLVGAGYVTSDQWASISAALITIVGLVAYKAAQHTNDKVLDKADAIPLK